MEIKNGDLECLVDTNITELLPFDNSIYRNKVVLKIEKILKRSIDIITSCKLGLWDENNHNSFFAREVA